MRRTPRAVLALIGATLPAAVLTAPATGAAQDRPAAKPTVDRIGADQIDRAAPADAADVQQITQGPRVLPPVPPTTRTADVGRQVGPTQDRSTVAASSGSSRADGTPAASAAIGGTDRCDAAAPGRPNVAVCRNPIERRAADYRPPEAIALSPEQRLAVARNAGDGAGTAREADRLARNPDLQQLSTTEQGVAALVLNTPPATETAQPTDEVVVDPAVFDAIIQIVGANTPPPK